VSTLALRIMAIAMWIAVGAAVALATNGNFEPFTSKSAANSAEREHAMTNTQVLKSAVIQGATWNDLKGLADFDPLQPAYLPQHTEVVYLAFTYFPFEGTTTPTTRNGIFVAQYRLPDGYLRLEQGWGMGLPLSDISNEPHGTVQAGSYEATWVRGRGLGGVGPPIGGKDNDSYLRLAWRPDANGATGPGWKLTTDTLSLDELTKVAASLR